MTQEGMDNINMKLGQKYEYYFSITKTTDNRYQIDNEYFGLYRKERVVEKVEYREVPIEPHFIPQGWDQVFWFHYLTIPFAIFSVLWFLYHLFSSDVSPHRESLSRKYSKYKNQPSVTGEFKDDYADGQEGLS